MSHVEGHGRRGEISGLAGDAYRYALPLVAVGLATAGALLVTLPDSAIVLPHVAAVGVSTWVGGVRPGLLSILLSMIAADLFFIPWSQFPSTELLWLGAFSICFGGVYLLTLHFRRGDYKDVAPANVAWREGDNSIGPAGANAATLLGGKNSTTGDLSPRDPREPFARASRVMTAAELTAAIAHEVNQPLTVMLANGSAARNWLQQDPPGLAEARGSLEAMITAAQRASDVIDSIHALTDPRSPTFEMLDLNETVNGVVLCMGTMLQEQQVVVRPHLASELPQIWGDRVQIQQLIVNLVKNAVEAMNDVLDRPRELTIRTCHEDDQRAVIIVEDTGHGLDTVDAQRVFTSFYSTKSNGIGIGLTICQSIVDRHGGDISARSRSPHGAIFRIRLPTGRQP